MKKGIIKHIIIIVVVVVVYCLPKSCQIVHYINMIKLTSSV